MLGGELTVIKCFGSNTPCHSMEWFWQFGGEPVIPLKWSIQHACLTPGNTGCNECWPWKCLEGFFDMIVFQLVFSGNTFHLAGLFAAKCYRHYPPLPPALPSFLAFFPFSFLHYKQQPNRTLNPWNQGKRDSVFWHDVMARFREAFSTVCQKFQNFSHQYKMYGTHKLTEEPFSFLPSIRGLFPSH